VSDPYGDDLGAPARPRQTQARSGSGGDHARAAIDSGSYVEVKVRIQEFYATYPTGALVTSKVKVFPIDEIDGSGRVMVQAKAYRSPDDPHPGVGTSWMVVPGKTPYTNGSEIENCETSAWGRAIAAVGIKIDQGIASAQEIRAKGGIEAPSTTNAEALSRAAEVAAEGAQVPVADAPVQESTTESLPVNPEGPAEAAPKPKPKAAKTKAPTPDPEAQAAPPAVDPGGLSYEEFIRLAREKFIPNGEIAVVARELVERKAIRAVGGVRDLTDGERMLLFMAAVVRSGDTPAGEAK